MIHRIYRLAVAVMLLSLASAHAAPHRAALVIGNGAYQSAPLANPVNDARDMASTLRKFGFDVTEVTNAGQREMNLAITAFGKKLKSDSVALFFYAGHGIQAKGKNHLLPIDAQIDVESSLRSEGVDVDAVLDQISGTGSQVNIVILDACRNNPFERRFRSAGGGLAQIDAPKGTLIAYATAPGKVASDGSGGKNGLYTSELFKALQASGAKVEEVKKNVRIEVAKNSNDNQIPWESSSLTGDFFFVPQLGRADIPRLLDEAGAAIQQRNLPLAIERAQAALAIHPRDPTALSVLAATSLLGGQMEEAAAYADQALSFNPLHSPAFNQRGLARERAGQGADAMNDFRRACELKNALGCRNAERLGAKIGALR